MLNKNYFYFIFFNFIIFSSIAQNNNEELIQYFDSYVSCFENNLTDSPLEALNCSEKALDISIILKDNSKQLIALYQLEVSYTFLKKYKIAINFALKGIELSDQLNEIEYKAKFESDCGRLFLELEKPDEALIHLNSAIEIYKLTSNKEQEIINLGNRAVAYGMKLDYENSKSIFENIKNHYKNKKDTLMYISTLTNIGIIHEKTNQLDSVFSIINRINELKIDTMSLANAALRNLVGDVYYKKKEYDKAIIEWNKTLYIAELYRKINIEEEALEKLGKAYYKYGDFENASINFKKHITIRDSILSLAEQKELQELNMLYKVSQKETTINKLIESKRRDKNINYLLVIFVVLALLILTIFIYKNRSRTKKLKHKNHLLSQELHYKKNDLTNFSVHYTELLKIIRTIKVNVNSIQKIKDDKELKNKVAEISKELSSNLTFVGDFNIKIIEDYIDKSNSNFINALEKLSPDLSTKEKRICSLILINCSSKEIGDIISISDKSLNNTRSLIRKKICIPKKESMNSFFKKLIR